MEISRIKVYKNFNRGDWALLKLDELINNLPNSIISDVGAGFGWFKDAVNKRKLDYQSFDRIQKTEDTFIWDLNEQPPIGVKKAGCIIMLEVIEHLDNPELAIRNLSDHLVKDGYLLLSSPNPYSAKNKFHQLIFNRYYAFQPKHLKEHHVYIPLPHVLDFHLKNRGFKHIEYGVLKERVKLKFEFNLRFFKNISRIILESMLSLGSNISKGNTQVFVYKKIID